MSKKTKIIFVAAFLLLSLAVASLQIKEVRYVLGLERNPSVDQPWAYIHEDVLKSSDGRVLE